MEWWKDLTDGDAAIVFEEASRPGQPASDSTKGKGRGKGKTKDAKSHRLSHILVANLNQQASRLLGDPTGQKVSSWTPAGHSV